MVNLEWYRSFVEVYRVGTVSGAANVLHLTQPAVSQHLAALESILGTTLFQRMPRRMLPTEAGKRLYTRVAAAIENLESIPIKGNLAGAPLLIRIGAPTDFFNEYVLGRLPQEDESLLKIKFGLASDLIEQLIAEQIDCAIATQKIPKPGLEYQLLFEENFWLVGPPDARPPQSQDLIQAHLPALEEWLGSQALIAYNQDLSIIRRFWRVVFGRRLDVNPKFVIPDLRSIRAAIVQGLGYSVLPSYLCTEWVTDGRLTLILKPINAVTNSVWLAYRKSERQSQQVMLLQDWLNMHP